MTTLLLKGRDPIDLLYSKSEVEQICVGRGRCKRIDFTIVHSSSGLDNYIMVIVKYFPMIPEFEVIVSKSLWKIYWRLFGIRLLLASERCFVVGWSLAVNFYYGRSHSVAWGRKIYKCNIDGGGLGVCSEENVRNFSCINVVLMEEAWEARSEENTRSSNN